MKCIFDCDSDRLCAPASDALNTLLTRARVFTCAAVCTATATWVATTCMANAAVNIRARSR